MMSSLREASQIAPGFAEPVLDSQACFRALLDAMAHPGRVVSLPVKLEAPQPLNPASLAVVLSLCDHETPLWLDEEATVAGLEKTIRFHCGAPMTEEPNQAAFALCCGPLARLDGFAKGTASFPERSTTIICQVAALDRGARFALQGPGIEEADILTVDGLPQDFTAQWRGNQTLFPQGVDLILTEGNRICALPRSLAVVAED